MWLLNPPEELLANPHTGNLHVKGRSPVCLRLCLVKSDLVVDANSHISHLNGRSPVCTRLWAANPILVVHAYPQPSKSQACGFSPVCVRLWVVKPPEWPKRCAQPSKSQAYGFSPVCVRIWTTKLALLFPAKLHSLQLNRLVGLVFGAGSFRFRGVNAPLAFGRRNLSMFRIFERKLVTACLSYSRYVALHLLRETFYPNPTQDCRACKAQHGALRTKIKHARDTSMGTPT